MTNLLHTIATHKNFYTITDRIATAISWDINQAYSIAYELGIMNDYNLLADTLKNAQGYELCPYDLTLCLTDDVIDLVGLNLFSFAYALFTECNMHTLAWKLEEFINKLSVEDEF